PAPFSPITVWISPGLTVSWTPSSAWTAPNRIEMSRISRSALESTLISIAFQLIQLLPGGQPTKRKGGRRTTRPPPRFLTNLVFPLREHLGGVGLVDQGVFNNDLLFQFFTL